MLFNKYINSILIIVGSCIAIYAQAEKEQNTYILVLGIAVLMFGLFRVSKTIPNKKNENHKEDEHEEL